jgi:hypothetical protein
MRVPSHAFETRSDGILGGAMKLSRRTFNVLLAIGIYMLLTWGTRVFTFLTEFREGTLVAPGIHFTLVVIGLSIGVYLTYLGIRGRRAARRARGDEPSRT